MDADAVAANFGGAQMQMCCRMVTLVDIFYVYPDMYCSTPAISIFVGARECVHEKPHACHTSSRQTDVESDVWKFDTTGAVR